MRTRDWSKASRQQLEALAEANLQLQASINRGKIETGGEEQAVHKAMEDLMAICPFLPGEAEVNKEIADVVRAGALAGASFGSGTGQPNHNVACKLLELAKKKYK